MLSFIERIEKHFTEYDLSFPMQQAFLEHIKKKGFNLTMNDGNTFFVPFDIILIDKVSYYFYDKKIETSFEDYFLSYIQKQDTDTLIDWAENNINWSEIEPFSRLQLPKQQTSYDEEWSNNEKVIV